MKLFAIFSFIVAIFAGARAVEACSCSPQLGTPKQNVANAKSNSSAVFVGKLTKLIQPKNNDGSFTGEVIAHFEVEKVWKGPEKAQLVVYTTNICCICGFPFEEGVRYLVYAFLGKDKLATSICTRTTPVGVDGFEDEQYLGTPILIERKKKPLDTNH